MGMCDGTKLGHAEKRLKMVKRKIIVQNRYKRIDTLGGIIYNEVEKNGFFGGKITENELRFAA